MVLPVDEGPLGVHEVELVVEPGPRLHDGRGVGQAAHRSLHLQHHGQMNYKDNEPLMSAFLKSDLLRHCV